MNYSYLLIRLFFSPIFPILLNLILFIVLKSFDSIVLCDVESIDQLKADLASYTAESRILIREFHFWSDLNRELANMPEPNHNTQIYYSNKVMNKYWELYDIMEKIRSTERQIVGLEPNYMSKVPIQWFEY